jgi:hypothetical protein
VTQSRIACVALVATLPVVFAASSRAQAPAADRSRATCFEIIAPQRHAEPASPILFDKCSGKTWLLVRAEGRHRPGYRWVSLGMDGQPLGGSPAAERPATSPVAAAAPNSGGRKCFVFAGRQYCE